MSRRRIATGLLAASALVALAGCADPGVQSPKDPAAQEQEAEANAEPTLPTTTSPTPPATTSPTLPITTAPTPPPASPSPSGPTSPPTNQRGNIVKALGEEGGIFNEESGEIAMLFTVDKITVGLPCTEPYYNHEPENGHIIGVDMRISTSSDLSTVGGSPAISSYDFSFVDPDGITQRNLGTIATYSCISTSEQIPTSSLGPGQNYVGSVVLDVPATTGTLIFNPSWSGTANGWEWPVG